MYQKLEIYSIYIHAHTHFYMAYEFSSHYLKRN